MVRCRRWNRKEHRNYLGGDKLKEKIEGKRKTNKIKIVFIVILVVAVLIYAGYTAWQLFAHPTDVFLVEQGSISEEIKAEGYIIRDETKVQGNNYKMV